MADGVAFFDGEYMPAHEVKIPLFDLGFTRGDAVYDTVSVWHGRFFRLDDHIARFLRSCAGARLTCPHPPEELKRILAECVHRAGLEDAYVQMIVTRGEFVSMTKRDPRLCRNRFVAFALPYIWNEDQTDAELRLVPDPVPVHYEDSAGKSHDFIYQIPNANECGQCHENNKQLLPIGPKARNLNKDFSYPDGKANQLQAFDGAGREMDFGVRELPRRVALVVRNHFHGHAVSRHFSLPAGIAAPSQKEEPVPRETADRCRRRPEPLALA
jgi:hypothetical protein